MRSKPRPQQVVNGSAKPDQYAQAHAHAYAGKSVAVLPATGRARYAASTTGQICDELIFEGVKCRLHTEISLRAHQSLVEVSDEEARKAWRFCFTTACWRNYLAKWEIRDGRLFLNSIGGKHALHSSEPLPADWVSVSLETEEVEVITNFWDADYNSGLPRQFAITVEAGSLVSSSYQARVRGAV